MEIRHDADRHRFVAALADDEAVLEYSRRSDGSLDYHHTYTPPALRGQGIAGTLVLFAFDHARARQLKVVPSCSFVRRVLREHPEYADIAAVGELPGAS
jgi:predicted GNAT family acetyltransferase